MTVYQILQHSGIVLQELKNSYSRLNELSSIRRIDFDHSNKEKDYSDLQNNLNGQVEESKEHLRMSIISLESALNILSKSELYQKEYEELFS